MLEIRPIRPADAHLLTEAFAFTSEKTYYQRFHAFRKAFSDDELAFLTAADEGDHVALVAIDHSAGQPRLASIVRFYVHPERRHEAEMAIVVHDPFQGCGLGRRMLTLAAQHAREMGIREFRAVIQPDNRRMRNLFYSLFPDAHVAHRDEFDVHYVATLDTPQLVHRDEPSASSNPQT